MEITEPTDEEMKQVIVEEPDEKEPYFEIYIYN